MPTGLLDLPLELLNYVSSELPNRDIKSLRRVCKLAQFVFRLRLHRVFLSPSRADIDAFQKVAQHETFRLQIVELVWDHSQFCNGNIYTEEIDSEESLDNLRIFQLLAERETDRNRVRCKRLAQAGYSEMRDGLPSFHQSRTSVQKCFDICKDLAENRKEIEKKKKDILALSRFIHHFPSLRRITISYAAHGWISKPFYETPLIRSFFRDFKYPITWSDLQDDLRQLGHTPYATAPEHYRRFSRGYKAIFEALTFAMDLPIEELLIETNGFLCGIPATFFESPRKEYRNFVSLLLRPQFTRLELAIVIDDPEDPEWECFRSGHLRDALQKATSLTHFSFTTNIIPNEYFHADVGGIADPEWISLRWLLPVDCWSKLKHFGLSQFIVSQKDLIALLAVLPRTVRSIELGFLSFYYENDSYAGLLDDVRSIVRWDERRKDERPRLVVALPISSSAPLGMANWVNDEIQCFLYDDGGNPFRGSRGPNDVDLGIGTERDAFNPDYECPHNVDFGWKEEVEKMIQREARRNQVLTRSMNNLAQGIEEEEGPEGSMEEELIPEWGERYGHMF